MQKARPVKAGQRKRPVTTPTDTTQEDMSASSWKNSRTARRKPRSEEAGQLGRLILDTETMASLATKRDLQMAGASSELQRAMFNLKRSPQIQMFQFRLQ
ncbi:hypothetical protein Q8A73_015846 [Channa argus]|nr:hypothetical protein Q8A73_015846 [Channa argus]